MKENKLKKITYDGIDIFYVQSDVCKQVNLNIGFKLNFTNCLDPKLGIAHMLEHMLFQSQIKNPNENILNSLLNRVYYVNALTNQDVISIEVTDSKVNLDEMFKVVSELLVLKDFKEEDFNKERTIILNEAHSVKNQQRMHTDFRLQTMWGDDFKNFSTEYVIGNEQTLQNITSQDVKDFYNKTFVKENFFISVGGNFSLSKIKKLYNKYIKNLLRSGEANHFKIYYKPEFNKFETKCIINNCGSTKNSVSLLLELPIKNTFENSIKLNYIRRYLNSTRNFVYKKLRYEKALLYGFDLCKYECDKNYILEFRFDSSLDKIKNIVKEFANCIKIITNGECVTKEYMEKEYKRDERINDLKYRVPPRSFGFVEDYYMQYYEYSRGMKRFCKNFENYKVINNFLKDEFKFERACLIITTSDKNFKEPFTPNQLKKLFNINK